MDLEVLKICYDLARLNFPADEKKTLADYQVLVDVCRPLLEVDTQGVQPMEFSVEKKAVLREDEPRESLDRELALKNAPDREYGYFRLRKEL